MAGRGGVHLESDLEFNKRLNTTSSLLAGFSFSFFLRGGCGGGGDKKIEKKKQEMGNKDGEGMKGGGGF